jgi:radical SAM superfamily enzyme YgiQ (UPF0313 family)
MRLSLVDNLLITRRGREVVYDLQPHLGLLSLIGAAQAAGHHCRLIDPKLELHAGRVQLDATLYRRIARSVLETGPDAVGLTSLGCNFVCTVKIARYLKQELPELPILLGGPHATILDQCVMQRFPEFDYVVRNEAEVTLPLLLGAIGAGRLPVAVPGVTYRAGGGIVCNPGGASIDDLDTLPLADYSHYPIRELGLSNLRVEAGRGCPYECTFCSTSTFFGRRYRLKSVPRLVAELHSLRERFGVSNFGLTHDLFTVNKSKVRDFCDGIRGRDLQWSCSARTDCVDPDLLAEMRAAGCTAIYYGIETGSRRMQRVIRKKLKLDGADPVIDATLKLGIATTASFITGYPDETEADQNETLDLIGSYYARAIAPLNVQLHLLTPEPGTDLVKNPDAELLFDGHISDFNFPTLESDDETMLRSEREVFVNHHYFRTLIARQRNIFVTEALPRLHALGFPVLSRIVARFDGRLSRFVEELMLGQAGSDAATDWYGLLISFFEQRFGDTDVLTAMVRYAASGARLLEAPTGPVRTEFQTGNRFRLSSSAALLRDMPDVPAMIAGLSRSESIEVDKTDDHGDWLICVDRLAKRSLRNLRLEPLAADMIEFLLVPRTISECRDRASAAHGSGEVDRFLVQLCEEGLLETAPPHPESVAAEGA